MLPGVLIVALARRSRSGTLLLLRFILVSLAALLSTRAMAQSHALSMWLHPLREGWGLRGGGVVLLQKVLLLQLVLLLRVQLAPPALVVAPFSMSSAGSDLLSPCL
jgi:hypothetical protein